MPCNRWKRSISLARMESPAPLPHEAGNSGCNPTDGAPSRPPEAVILAKKDNHSPTQDTRNEEIKHWDVAIIGSVALVFGPAVFSTSGLFYVYFMDAFGISREAASWITTTTGVTFGVSGLVVTLLQRFLGIFEIGLIGSVVLWASVIASSFVPSVELMTLFLGALHGLGIGLVDSTIAVTIGTVFLKHRGVAMGVKDSGRTLSALIFPSVVSKLNAHYGFRGALLICGALLMNVTAFMLMLRRPQLRCGALADRGNNSKNLSHSLITKKACKQSATGDEEEEDYTLRCSGKYQSFKEHSKHKLDFRNDEKCETNTVHAHRKSGSGPEEENGRSPANTPSRVMSTMHADVDICLDGSDNLNTQRILHNSVFQLEKTSYAGSRFLSQKKTVDSSAAANIDAESLPGRIRTDPARIFCGYAQTLLADPRFYVLAFQNMVLIYWAVVNRSIGVDYARDKGVPTAYAELLGTYAAAPDFLLGRICIPFLADRGCLKRSVLVALTFALLSATLVAMTFTDGILQFLPVWITMSFLVSATESFSPVLIADCLGADRVPVTWGSSGLVSGPLLLVTPYITGFFRDTMGSYDNLVRLVAALAALSALLVFSLPILGRRNSNLGPNIVTGTK